MTVVELLNRIIDAYPGATPEAMQSFKSAFYGRLQRHEGPLLAEATDAVLGSFKPKYGQPFPIPADFEAHLPSGKLNLPSEGHSIRQALKDRAERQKRAFSAWLQTQGVKIKQARPVAVYNACVMLAADLAKQSDRVILKPEQITLCEERALSQARVQMFGALPRTSEAWQAQIEQVRASWTAGGSPEALRERAA